jgi:C4-type Zn-finger protein
MHSEYVGKCPICGGAVVYKEEKWGDDADGNRGIMIKVVECTVCDWQPGEKGFEQPL